MQLKNAQSWPQVFLALLTPSGPGRSSSRIVQRLQGGSRDGMVGKWRPPYAKSWHWLRWAPALPRSNQRFVFLGTKFGILPTKERTKKKASATHTKAQFFLGGLKNGPKSPDYEDQKFEIAVIYFIYPCWKLTVDQWENRDDKTSSLLLLLLYFLSLLFLQ